MWSDCQITAASELRSILWRFLHQQKKSHCGADKAFCIEIGGWSLQQGWRWWHCDPDWPPEPQQECHVVPQSGPSGFCRTFCLVCTHFCTTPVLYIEPLPPAVEPASEQPLKRKTRMPHSVEMFSIICQSKQTVLLWTTNFVAEEKLI